MFNDLELKDILNIGLSTGADLCEIYFEDKTKNVLEAEGGLISSANNAHTRGAGVRIIKDDFVVYGYTNELNFKNLTNLTADLASSFTGNKKTCLDFVKENRSPFKIIKHPEDVSIEEKAEIIKKMHDYAFNYDQCITQTKGILLDESQDISIVNSNGKYVADTRVRTRFYIISIAKHNDAIQTGSEGPGGQVGYELFDQIDLKKVCLESARTAKKMVYADECPSKEMPVIIHNGFGGVIFHEACGHPLEASGVAKGLSVFTGKLGQQIASTLVTAIDDGTIENGWGSSIFDDEGNLPQKNILIENGILKNYLIDEFNGKKMNLSSNGACRRESYKHLPTSRMSNTYIDNGESTFEEIIQKTKYGLFAKKLGGGSVNPATGDFNFSVLEGYIVEDGKIGKPVKGATLVGNGANALMKIDMVANNLLRAQGMCGASSGALAADVGQPTIRVSKMTVGGRGE